MGEKKIIIRNAKGEDIPTIREMELASWGEELAATEEMFRARLEVFPKGVFVALMGERLVGVVVTEILANYDLAKPTPKWLATTDNGFIRGSHDPKGDTFFGVDLSTVLDVDRAEVGTMLVERERLLLQDLGLKRGVLGSRIPAYHRFAGKMPVEEYVWARDPQTGLLLDWQLNFYSQMGFAPVKIMPDYIEDPESMNFGVIVVWENPRR